MDTTFDTHFRRVAAMAAFVFLILLMVVPAQAGNRGKGHGAVAATAATCWLDGTTVRAVDLPDDEVINFMVTDSTGTTGWVLGTSSWWNVAVSDPLEPTTYAFVSRTWGKNGSKYKTFAVCTSW